MMVDVDCLISNQNSNLASGCLIPAGELPQNNRIGRMIDLLKQEYNFSYTTRWKDIPMEAKQIIIYGDNFKFPGMIKNFSFSTFQFKNLQFYL